MLLESKQQDLLKNFLKEQSTQDVWSEYDDKKFKTGSGDNEKEYVFDSTNKNNWFTIRCYLLSKFRNPMRFNNDKYQYGIGRIATEELEKGTFNEAMFNNEIYSLVKAVIDTEDDEYNFNGKSFDVLKSEHDNKIKARNDEVLNRIKDKTYEENDDYDIVEIKTYNEAQEYYKYTRDLDIPWCITESEASWNSYSRGGINRIYFALKDGFEELTKPETMSEEAPYDEYGLSMMFIAITPSGMINNITSRWNHDCKKEGSGKWEGYGISDSHYFEKDDEFDTDTLSKMFGENFYNIFRPYDFKAVLRHFLNKVDINSDFIYIIEDGRGNYVVCSKETNSPVSETIYSFISKRPTCGMRLVKNAEGMFGFLDEMGNEIVKCRYEDADEFNNDIACVKRNDKYGFVDTTGKEIIPCKFSKEEIFRKMNDLQKITYESKRLNINRLEFVPMFESFITKKPID